MRGERQAGRNFFMRWATGSSNSIVTAKLKYRCELCNCAFERKKNYEQHMAGQQHRSNVAAVNITWERFITCASKWGDNPQVSNDGQNFTLHGESVSMEEVVQAWSMEELERFPMRATCLSPRTFFADLPLLSKARLWKYVSELMPYYGEEIPSIFFAVACGSGRAFRVKEVVEACESFKLLEAFLLSTRRLRPALSSLLDAACGHGLVGMLLAYRFPSLSVLALDLEPRSAMHAWRAAFEEQGSKLAAWPAPLHNFRFLAADLNALHPSSPPHRTAPPVELGEEWCVVAVHACNDVNRVCIEAAVEAGAAWAVMPCCVPQHTYLPGCGVGLADGGAGDVRHTFLCGAIAARYGAQLVAQIDTRVTNRAILVAGGCTELEPGQKLGTGRAATKVDSSAS